VIAVSYLAPTSDRKWPPTGRALGCDVDVITPGWTAGTRPLHVDASYLEVDGATRGAATDLPPRGWRPRFKRRVRPAQGTRRRSASTSAIAVPRGRGTCGLLVAPGNHVAAPGNKLFVEGGSYLNGVTFEGTPTLIPGSGLQLMQLAMTLRTLGLSDPRRWVSARSEGASPPSDICNATGGRRRCGSRPTPRPEGWRTMSCFVCGLR